MHRFEVVGVMLGAPGDQALVQRAAVVAVGGDGGRRLRGVGGRGVGPFGFGCGVDGGAGVEGNGAAGNRFRVGTVIA
ncbi:hypothetical protein ABZW30_12860 [Kitasatospora sp. NPDC004669]|uniref:hypothetical protein n=1 Tax=Kitasatospora sp. NPDC004669 TaxID=3154555 RepID=UPI0033BA1CB2